MEIPSTPWRAEPWAIDEALEAAPLTANWTALPGVVDHVFTHFSLELSVVVAQAGRGVNVQDDSEWCPVDRLDERALPSVMRKIVEHALAAEVQS